jgi:hypothetical protein
VDKEVVLQNKIGFIGLFEYASLANIESSSQGTNGSERFEGP